jgi:hypothetical protein
MRYCNDWLGTLREYVEETESPRHFWLWSGVSCLASALQRKVSLPFGLDRLYPNLYVMLVAAPGECRKSVPMKLHQKLLNEIEIPMFADTPTKRSFTRSLADIGETCKYDLPCGETVPQSAMTIISKEFSSFLATDPKGMIEILTDLYDSHDEWEYKTDGSGQDKLFNVCINAEIATTPKWMMTNLPEGAIGGGFTSRFVIVYGDKKHKWLSLPPEPPKGLYKNLVADLKHIGSLSGTFRWEKAAYERYDEWYRSIEQTQRNLKDDRLRGFVSRMHTMMLKVAMILQVSSSDDLIITATNISRSIRMMDEVLTTASGAFGGHGGEAGGNNIEKILKQIVSYREISYNELLQMNFRHTNKDEFDTALDTLEGMGVVTKEFNGQQTIIKHKGYVRGHGKLKGD